GGYEDGSFRPNASITRAEFVAIATRFFDYSARYEGGFTDVSYGDWYADCVQASADMGLVNGYEDGSFRPNASITRAEACAIVNRVLHRIPHEDHLLSESVMNVWPDNPKSAWYYADMQEATNSHDYDWTRESGSVVEDWTDKLPERDWSALETEWANAYSK
ncbi:MAG TPA: S-layer homology domain-containing protein, partial [Candidatus Scatomorpha stercoravium]|nr:S-layer homology domain-containing protein [Candidatus Scatomorpha stercoravium]